MPKKPKWKKPDGDAQSLRQLRASYDHPGVGEGSWGGRPLKVSDDITDWAMHLPKTPAEAGKELVSQPLRELRPSEKRMFFGSSFEHRIGLRLSDDASAYVADRIGVAVSGAPPLPRSRLHESELVARHSWDGASARARAPAPPAQRERLSPRAQAERHAARTALRKQQLATGWEELAEKTKSPGREGWWEREAAAQAEAEAAAWQEVVDEESGDKFWWNELTEESQWKKPAQASASPEPEPEPEPDGAPDSAAEAKLDKMLEAEPAQPTAEALEKFFPGIFMEETADGLKRRPGAADRGARVLTMLEDPVAPHLDLDDLSGTKPFERKRLFNMLEELGSGAARRSGNMAALLGGDSPSAGPEPEPEPEPEPASEPEPEPASEPQPDAEAGETHDEAKEP